MYIAGLPLTLGGHPSSQDTVLFLGSSAQNLQLGTALASLPGSFLELFPNSPDISSPPARGSPGRRVQTPAAARCLPGGSPPLRKAAWVPLGLEESA